MNDYKDFQELPGKAHLKKDFGAELNYKLWVTKGARFYAAKRLQKKSTLSVFSIGFLSGYILIINLLAFFPEGNPFHFDTITLTITTIALSILVLIFSQIETANNYSLKADKLHNCAMEIGKIYNEWRYNKTLVKENLNGIIKDLTTRYEIILDKFDNHDDIDTQLFKAKHNYYFKFSKKYVTWAHINYYIKVYLKYHILIFVPIIAFILKILSAI